jgi:hypothetical protein
MLSRIRICLLLLIFSLITSRGFAQNTAEKTPDDSTKKNPPALGEIFKPTIGLGVGNLSFFGDLYTKHFQPPMVSRFAYQLDVSSPLTQSLYLNFHVMFGKLGANERTPTRNENFESTIRLGGVQLLYDFSNFIKKQRHIRPYILTGIEGFEFLSKTDLKDKYGNTYYYWSDGSIKNMPQGSPGSDHAINLVRDYKYESDIRELNRDGFGKYQERSWAIPVGAGFIMNVGERFKFRCGATMHFTATDYIDGITSKSLGNRKGNSANDKFMMMSASLHYDLVIKKQDRTFDTLMPDHFTDIDWMAIDNGDEDGDGVKDFDDACHRTPAGVKIDAKGCPVDEDNDMIADYYDEELPTPAGMLANVVGIGITDAMAQEWYDWFYDTTGGVKYARVVILDTVEKKGYIKKPSKAKQFTVELARYKGGVPSDEMAFLLSIGDVQSFTLGDETVVYAAGDYNDVRIAVKRRDEFLNDGIKSAKVGYFKGSDYYNLSDQELQNEIALADKKFGNTSNATNDNAAVGKDQIVYRVQLGAYKNKLPTSLFRNVGNVIEVKTDDGYYRYSSGIHKTLQDAAYHRAELVLEGYSDAFITAYKNGKRIPLNEAGATYEDKNYKEDITDKNTTSSTVDKSHVSFRIQIGVLKKTSDPAFEERIKNLKDVSKQTTATGSIRYMVGDFQNYNDALKYKATLVQEGFPDAFVIATFNGEVISVQEALEMTK